MNTRKEKDSLGFMDIPQEVYYGIHTARSLANFDVAGQPLPLAIVHAAVELKLACARANRQLGQLAEQKTEAIVAACTRVLAGEFDDQFVVDVFQAGSGTSSNMNINEVIANIACEHLGGAKGGYDLVHPNDDVNMGQSTNNIIPSAIRVAYLHSNVKLRAQVGLLAGTLREKSREFADVLKSGRTHLQDAVPLTLGQEFGAYARAVEKAERRIADAERSMLELGIGGNAVGTGINTKATFRTLIIENLNRSEGFEFKVAEDGIEATQFLTDMAGCSAALRLLAADLTKIANDLRLLSSGPNVGLAEITLPAVEPGSSIMPGKINPSICEAANMACIQVMGNDTAVSIACSGGQLELNTHMPLVGTKLLESTDIMRRCCAMLADKCIVGIKANREVCERNFQASAGLATVLNPVLGYDKVSELVKESLKCGTSVKNILIERGLMSVGEIEELLIKCTGPQ